MDAIAAAVGAILETDEEIKRVFVEPPESVTDYPAALVLEINGETAREGYGGLWEAEVKIRVWLLAVPRRHLPVAVKAARPWVPRLLGLFQRHDMLAATEGDEELGEITGLAWTLGNLAYAKIDHAGVELIITARVDQQVLLTCGKVALTP